MLQIRHFNTSKSSQRDNHLLLQISKARYNVPGLFCVPKAFKTFKEWWDKTKNPEVAEKARTSLLQKLRENQAIVDQRKEQQGPNLKRNNLSPER